MTSGAGYPSSYYPYIIATLVDTVPQECGGTGGQVINSTIVMVVIVVVIMVVMRAVVMAMVVVIMVALVVRSKTVQHQMVNIVFVVLLVMIIKMSRIDKTIKVAQTEGESLLASSALNVLSLQQQVGRSELSLSFNFHFLSMCCLFNSR